MDREVRERVLKLVDELLRRGVPMDALFPILDWLDAQTLGAKVTGPLRRDHGGDGTT